jgi:hypothetical protein
MTRWEIKNATEKIDGYFLPSPTKPGGMRLAFERAKRDCINRLEDQTRYTNELTYEQFMRQKRKKS